MDLYDSLGEKIGGMKLDTQILVFNPKGSDKEYRLQFWKGSYAGGGAYGGEIGLYERSEKKAKRNPYVESNPVKKYILYDCVPEEDEIKSVQKIYKMLQFGLEN